MKKMTRAALGAAAAATAVFALAACSSSPAPTPASSTPAPSSSAPMPGESPNTWAPLELTLADSGSTVDMVVGQNANIVGLPAASVEYVLESSDPKIVTVAQASDANGVVTVPGISAVGAGTATVTLFDGNPADSAAQPIMIVTVNVNAGEVGTNPGTWAPVELTLADSGSTVDMVVGQNANIVNLPPAGAEYVLESSDPKIVKVSQGGESGGVTVVPGISAVGAGTATVTLFDGNPADSAAQPIMIISVQVAK